MLDANLLNFVKNKSSSLVNKPADMLQFSCLQYAINNEYVDEYSNFGFVKYFSKEEEDNSKKDWPDDFSYFINDIGFRGNYPSTNNKSLFAFFGCSVGFGQGLPEHQIYADLISQHYNKKYLNLGIPGAGIHRTALTFSAAARIWDIETAVINLPPFTRLHYVDTVNRLQSILLTHNTDQLDIEAVRISILKNFSNQFLVSYSIDAIQWIIDIAKSKKINLVLSSWDPNTIQIIETGFNLDVLKFNMIDTARDNHPGIESHKIFADEVINILANETYIC
jgi:hypothetical protein